MNPGKLDRRVTIQALVETRDELGGVARSFVDFKKVWASKEDKAGDERGFAAALRGESGAVFTIRFLAGLTTLHRLVYNAVVYDIVALQELGRRQYQLLTCRIVQSAAP